VDAFVYVIGALIFVIGLYLVLSPWLRKSRRPKRGPSRPRPPDQDPDRGDDS
jgi:hypothetical protein